MHNKSVDYELVMPLGVHDTNWSWSKYQITWLGKHTHGISLRDCPLVGQHHCPYESLRAG